MNYTIKNNLVIHDRFFKIKEAVVSYDHFDGQTTIDAKRWAISKGHAVACIIYLTDLDRYVLIEQFRFPVTETYEDHPWIMEVPAGTIDPGESPEQAIDREVLEETGYQIIEKQAFAEFFTTPGICSEKIYLYYATADSRQRVSISAPDEEEDIRIHLFSADELSNLIITGQIKDGKTLVAIYHVLNKLIDH